MADTTQLETALANADRAGDVTAARQLAAEIMRVRGDQNVRVVNGIPVSDAPGAGSPVENPSEGGIELRPFGISTGVQMPQGVSRFLAGTGKAMVDVGRGAGQLIHDGLDLISPADKNIQSTISGKPNQSFADRMGLPNGEDADYNRQLDKSLMDTGAGIGGNVAGGVAMSLPAMLAGPAGATIAGQAGIGALQGALQPVGAKDSRMQNMAIGGSAGAALPTALRAAKVLKAGLVDPFTEAGRTRIVGGALNRAASNPVEAAANLEMAQGATPGFNPTAGQAGGDAGIASLERAGRAIDPAGFGDVDTQQRTALANALRNIAGTPETRVAAVKAREDATNQLYRQAEQASIPVDAELGALMQRPSMQSAAADAQQLAAERGKSMIQQDGPPSLTGESLHDIKLSLDTLFKDPTKGIVGAKRDAANATRTEFLDLLAQRIPAYDQARTTFAGMSKPINQQDVGQELYNRLVPAVADIGDAPSSISAARFAQALRNGDDLASNVTGMSNSKLSKVMSPEQMATINGVNTDAQSIYAAQNAGRGVGSDTVQKMAMSNLIDQAGLPTWIGALAPLRSVGGMARTAGDFLMTKNDETMRHLLADVLKDPARAAGAMKKAGVSPSKFAEYLKQAGAAANPAIPAAALEGN